MTYEEEIKQYDDLINKYESHIDRLWGFFIYVCVAWVLIAGYVGYLMYSAN